MLDSYVKLDGPLDYGAWCEGVRQGRAYVSEGMSHLMEFRVDGVAVGERGNEVRLRRSRTVRVEVKAAALLDVEPVTDPGLRPDFFWDLERARIAGTRTVPVEVIVNGFPAAKQTIVADGTLDLGYRNELPILFAVT